MTSNICRLIAVLGGTIINFAVDVRLGEFKNTSKADDSNCRRA